MKIFADIREGDACCYHRIANPLQYMQGVEIVKHPYDADIFFFNKYTYRDIELLKGKGIKVVVDMDDYWHLPADHFYYEDWRLHDVTSKCRLNMHMADTVITTNAVLAEKIRPLNKNVHVIPNALPYGQGQFDIRQASWTGSVKFVGGKSHYKDIKMIPGYGIPVRLPVESYMNHYQGINVSLAPLIDNEFNRYKSNLKILEAGAAGCACIASDVTAFAGMPVRKVAPGEWEGAIKDALRCPDETQHAGRRLAEYCREFFDLPKVNELRTKLLNNL